MSDMGMDALVIVDRNDKMIPAAKKRPGFAGIDDTVAYRCSGKTRTFPQVNPVPGLASSLSIPSVALHIQGPLTLAVSIGIPSMIHYLATQTFPSSQERSRPREPDGHAGQFLWQSSVQLSIRRGIPRQHHGGFSRCHARHAGPLTDRWRQAYLMVLAHSVSTWSTVPTRDCSFTSTSVRAAAGSTRVRRRNCPVRRCATAASSAHGGVRKGI